MGGVIVVVSFHSIEDKIVKYFFKHYSEESNSSRYFPDNPKVNKLFKVESNKPLKPSKYEILENPPSRSAKLRFGFKINNSSNFDDFLNKFQYLLKIEDIGKNL